MKIVAPVKVFIEESTKNSGKQFDPVEVKIFTGIKDKITPWLERI